MPAFHPAAPAKRPKDFASIVPLKRKQASGQRSGKTSTVEIFTDGSCLGNPGPGGYGVILKFGEKEKEISGYVPHTTNNRMELTAVIEALRMLKRPSMVRVITDSNYVVKGMKEWMDGWIKKNWHNSRKQPVLNRDLWEQLLALTQTHSIEWKWVKGHHGHPQNERCDKMAKNAIEKGLARQVGFENHEKME